MTNELKFEDKMLAVPELQDAKPTYHDIDRQRVIDLYNQLTWHYKFGWGDHLQKDSDDEEVNKKIDELMEFVDDLQLAISRFHNEPMSALITKEYDMEDEERIKELTA